MEKLKFCLAKEVAKRRDGTKTTFTLSFEDGTDVTVSAYHKMNGRSIGNTVDIEGGYFHRNAYAPKEKFYEDHSSLRECDVIYFFSAGLPCRLTSDGTLVPKQGWMGILEKMWQASKK